MSPQVLRFLERKNGRHIHGLQETRRSSFWEERRRQSPGVAAEPLLEVEEVQVCNVAEEEEEVVEKRMCDAQGLRCKHFERGHSWRRGLQLATAALHERPST